jgi:hypothetical protein
MGRLSNVGIVIVWTHALLIVASWAGGQDWTLRQPATSPSARYFHSMAYDSARRCVVLFGGYNMWRSGHYDETWVWDGSQWTQKKPKKKPAPRYGHAMAYDSSRSRVIVFGGNGVLGPLNDTWEWDGGNWSRRATSLHPPAVFFAAMAYDSARRRAVLFGAGVSANETWEWDGTTWVARKPAVSPPSAIGHAMVYDNARKKVVLLGGTSNPVFHWEWDGVNWTSMRATPSALVRSSRKGAYDAGRRRVVLFGGTAGGLWVNDTWEWDGNAWSLKRPNVSPAARDWHAIAYDASRQRTVVFGGQVLSGATNETWEYGLPATISLTGATRPSSTVSLLITAANDAGLSYQAGSSLGAGPIRIDTRQLKLSADELLRVTVSNAWPSIFSGYHGILDSRGQAQGAIRIPSFAALVGTRVHTAFVTLDPKAPSGVRTISTAAIFSVTP